MTSFVFMIIKNQKFILFSATKACHALLLWNLRWNFLWKS